MYQSEETRFLLPPQDMRNLVNRIANGERIFRFARKKAKFEINGQIVEDTIEDTVDTEGPGAEKKARSSNRRLEHFLSWGLLASVYYENVGMLNTIINAIKAHSDIDFLFNDDEEIKYFKSLTIGPDPRRQIAWTSREKKLLFWSIMVTNNPVITEIVYREGGLIEKVKANQNPMRFPSFMTNHVFSVSRTSGVNLFSISKSDFKPVYEEAASRNEDGSIAVPVEKWIQDRIQIIKLVIKYENPKNTVFRKPFLDLINSMHADYADVQKELNMLVFFEQKMFKKEMLKSDHIKSTLKNKHAHYNLLSSFQFNENSALLSLYDELKKMLPKDKYDLNEIVLKLYKFKFIQENWSETFCDFIFTFRNILKEKMDSTERFNRFVQILIDNRKGYNLDYQVAGHQDFINSMAVIAGLPDELFMNKDYLNNIVKLITSVNQEITDELLLLNLMKVFNLDTINSSQELSTFRIEETNKLKTSLERLDCINKYWDRTINTFFFTNKSKDGQHSLICNERPIYLPAALTGYIASFLNFGDVKVKRKENKARLVKPSLPKVTPQLKRPKRGNNDQAQNNTQLTQSTEPDEDVSDSDNESMNQQQVRVTGKRPAEDIVRRYMQFLIAQRQAQQAQNMPTNGKRPRLQGTFGDTGFPTAIPMPSTPLPPNFVPPLAVNPLAMFYQPITYYEQQDLPQATLPEEEMIDPEYLFDQSESFNYDQ